MSTVHLLVEATHRGAVTQALKSLGLASKVSSMPEGLKVIFGVDAEGRRSEIRDVLKRVIGSAFEEIEFDDPRTLRIVLQ